MSPNTSLKLLTTKAPELAPKIILHMAADNGQPKESVQCPQFDPEQRGFRVDPFLQSVSRLQKSPNTTCQTKARTRGSPPASTPSHLFFAHGFTICEVFIPLTHHHFVSTYQDPTKPHALLSLKKLFELIIFYQILQCFFFFSCFLVGSGLNLQDPNLTCWSLGQDFGSRSLDNLRD